MSVTTGTAARVAAYRHQRVEGVQTGRDRDQDHRGPQLPRRGQTGVQVVDQRHVPPRVPQRAQDVDQGRLVLGAEPDSDGRCRQAPGAGPTSLMQHDVTPLPMTS